MEVAKGWLLSGGLLQFCFYVGRSGVAAAATIRALTRQASFRIARSREVSVFLVATMPVVGFCGVFRSMIATVPGTGMVIDE